jgi:hypothetical protein
VPTLRTLLDAHLRCEVSKVTAHDENDPANRSLPRIPDLVDFVASQVGIDVTTIRKLSREEAFIGSLSAWPALRGLAASLGYMAWHFMKHRGASNVGLSDDQAVDYVRLGLHCAKLPMSDRRHVALDVDRSRSIFPELYSVDHASAAHDQQILGQLGTFAALHPMRLVSFLEVRIVDERTYIAFWIDQARDQIARHLSNERFVAGLDAVSQNLLTFHGFLEKVYGVEHYDRILAPRAYALFDALDPALTARVIMTLAGHVSDGRLKIARNLDRKYPDIYEFYKPERHGARLRSD